jgi:hypothetical protein
VTRLPAARGWRDDGPDQGEGQSVHGRDWRPTRGRLRPSSTKSSSGVLKGDPRERICHRPADRGGPRLRRGCAAPAGGIHRHVHQPVRRHRRRAPARGHRRRRPAAPADPRLARVLVLLAPGDAGARRGLRGHRGRPARDRALRQARGGLRHGHARERPRRADGRARPRAVRGGRRRHGHADRLRTGRGSPQPRRASRSRRSPTPGHHAADPAGPPGPGRRPPGTSRSTSSGRRTRSSFADARTSSSARSSPHRPGRTNCRTTPSSTTSRGSPRAPRRCTAASSSTAPSAQPRRRTRNARPAGCRCPSSRWAERRAWVRWLRTR